MKLRYSRRATRDLDATHEYLAKRSPGGAVNVMAAIFASVEFIRRHPEAAPAVSNIAGVRGVVVHRYRFKVFYRILAPDEIVEIITSGTRRGDHGPVKWTEARDGDLSDAKIVVVGWAKAAETLAIWHDIRSAVPTRI